MSWKRKIVKLWRGLNRLAEQIKIVILTLAVTVPLVGSRMPTMLEQVQSQGKLVVLSRNGPATYYEDANGYTGPEYVLASAFAKHLGVKLEVVEEENLSRLIDVVGEKGHLAAAGLTITPKRQRSVVFSKPYMKVTQQLVYNAEEPKPKTITDLIGKHVLVVANSSHAEHLRELQKLHPELKWEERSDVEMIDLQEMVHHKKIDFAIVDSNSFELNSAIYPQAKVAFDITEAESLAWAFPISHDTSLLDAANEFLSEFELSGKLDEIRETFYGHLDEIDHNDALMFSRRVASRLPKWQPLIEAAAEEAELDWRLLAALAYQESHWNPVAESRTGVRGFMMLTRTTAKEMKVSNRDNAAQSIKGGTLYFRKLLDRIPENITGEDRFWFALAAYNVGYGHVEDARVLAERNGADPNQWADVREYLPLLSKRQHYKFTKHGYARGYEAVTYVQNIRSFYSILARNEIEKERLTEVAMSHDDESAPKDEETNSEFNSIISEVIAKQRFSASAL
jgi:membrane-bound lytic murein transglycosylase F